MKIYALCTLLLFSIFFTACNDREIDFGGGGNNNYADITANIDGGSWGVPNGYARNIQPFGLEIYGADNNTSIAMYISPYNGPGNYQLNGNTVIRFVEGGVEYTSTVGQINIYTDDGYIMEGDFNCQAISNTGSTSLSFTEGRFSVTKN